MASASEITTDASISKVVEILGTVPGVQTGDPQFDPGFDDPTWYMVTTDGGRMTVASDLKFETDEIETWIAVYEQSDDGLANRLFNALSSLLPDRVTLFAKDSTEIIAEVNSAA